MLLGTDVLGKDVQSIWRHLPRGQIGARGPTMIHSFVAGQPTGHAIHPLLGFAHQFVALPVSCLRCCASLLSCRFGAQNRELHNANHMDSRTKSSDRAQASWLAEDALGIDALRPHQVQPVHDLALETRSRLDAHWAAKACVFSCSPCTRWLCIVVTPWSLMQTNAPTQVTRHSGGGLGRWQRRRVLDNVRFGDTQFRTWPQSDSTPLPAPSWTLGCPDCGGGRGALHFPMGT